MQSEITIFEDYKIRRIYDELAETWFFSVVDIIQVLIQQNDYKTARKYWNKLKERLKKEGSESVTNCHQLKLEAADGKKYLTDTANAETILRLVQSIPSPKAEHEVSESKDYATLTNVIHQEWSGVTVKKHKEIKGLAKDRGLRDHM